MKSLSYLPKWISLLIACCCILVFALLLSQAQGQSRKDCLNLTEIKESPGALTITNWCKINIYVRISLYFPPKIRYTTWHLYVSFAPTDYK